MNSRTQNIGARRLHTVLEKVLEETSFAAPDLSGKTVKVDAAYVREKLEPVLKDIGVDAFLEPSDPRHQPIELYGWGGS